MKERFVVNGHIDVVLEDDGKTRVYIDGMQFVQCMRLLLTIPLGDDASNADVASIDDAKNKYGTVIEGRGFEPPVQHVYLDPLTEFRGHCSNIQAWAENDYNTRLLHSNISFPLLKILATVGDAKAKRVLDAELLERIRDGTLATKKAILESCGDLLDPDLFTSVLRDVPLEEGSPIWHHYNNALDKLGDDRKAFNMAFQLSHYLESVRAYESSVVVQRLSSYYLSRFHREHPDQPTF